MRSTITAFFTAIALSLSGTAHAAETKPFDQATFQALQAGGKPILIDVYADWWPTCNRCGKGDRSVFDRNHHAFLADRASRGPVCVALSSARERA